MTLLADYWVIIASFMNTGSAGLHVYRMDAKTGVLTHIRDITQGVTQPLFLTTDVTKKYLYAADHTKDCNQVPGGALAAYAIDAQKGDLTFLNHQPSGGKVPCYVSLSQNGRFALVANYNNGKVSMRAIQPDGSLGGALQILEQTGHSIHLQRQTASHPHSFLFSPDNRFALSADLGTDQIFVYRFDAQAGTLTPHDPAALPVTPGSGPRHIAFNPQGDRAFVMTELDNTIFSFQWDAQAGTLKLLHSLSALPEDFKQDSYGADIHVHPNGRFLYVSNRGHDSIGVFAIDPTNSHLSLIEHQSTGGSFPRGFALDPTGRFLYVANEKSDNLVSFSIDAKTGKLTPMGTPLQVSSPVSIVFIPVQP